MVSTVTPIGRQAHAGTLRPGGASEVNVGDTERMLSAVGGGALVLLGLGRRSLPGLAVAGIGASLLYRGLKQLREMLREAREGEP